VGTAQAYAITMPQCHRLRW